MTSDKLAVVQEFFQQCAGDRVNEAVKLLDPAVAYHGTPIKGALETFVGPAEVAKHLKMILEMTERPINVLKWEDWLVGNTHVAGIVRVELQRLGQFHNFRILFLVGVSPDTRIDRVEVFYSDPEACERFFSR